jgi:ABC-type multidrug transport system ATPase subunit
MNSQALFKTKGLCLEGGYVFDDVSVLPGEVLWINSENPFELDIFVAFILGLINIKSGKGSVFGKKLVSGKKISALPHGIVSYFDIVNWYPELKTIEALINVLAHSRGLQSSFVLTEFKRLLHGIGAAYALNLELNKMTRVTKMLLSTALVMSMPSLIMLLIEPFEALDKDGANFLDKEIKNVARDGSSVFILSGSEPSFYDSLIKIGKKQ